ncbi:MAG TPA: peptidoglycan DD-metalloendopeptidase family protein [Rhodanobacteraceae bacterium]
MFALKFSNRLSMLVVATMLLAGCATTPAPVVNHSFGGSSPPPAEMQSSQPAPPSSGAQTFGIGGQSNPAPAGAITTTTHANGTMGANGYIVAPGDTLYSIAFAHGMDVRDLAALNAIPPPYVLHPGQVLKLKPGQGTVATTTTTTVTTTSRPTAIEAPPPSSAPVFGAVTPQTMGANGVAPAEPQSTAAAAPSVVPVAGEPVPSPTPPSESVPPSVPVPAPGGTRSVAGITWQWPAQGKLLGGFSAGTGGEGAGLNIAGNMGDPVRAAAAGIVVYSGNGLPGYGELVIIKHNDTYLSAYGYNSKRLVKEGDHVAAGQEIALMGASGAPRVELHFEIRKDGKPVDPLGYLPSR